MGDDGSDPSFSPFFLPFCWFPLPLANNLSLRVEEREKEGKEQEEGGSGGIPRECPFAFHLALPLSFIPLRGQGAKLFTGVGHEKGRESPSYIDLVKTMLRGAPHHRKKHQ